MIEAVGHGVFGDVGVDEEDLAVLRMSIGFGDVGLPVAQALHLAAHQHQSSFKRGLDEIEMPRLAIVGDHPMIGVFLLGHQGIGSCAASMATRTVSRPCCVNGTMGSLTSGSHSPSKDAAYLVGAGLASQKSASCRPISRS